MRRLLACLCVISSPVWAETQISIYGGIQEASPGRVSGNAQGVPFGFMVDWQGNSTQMPPYYGIRATRWLAGDLGLAIEFSHTKVYADDQTLASSGFQVLEFTDGLNSLTLNAMQRYDAFGALRPYAGLGIGLSVPHVEVQSGPGNPLTFEYQLAGPSARAIAGLEYDLNEKWSLFGELNATWSSNQTDLKGGGQLDADIFTQALNIGASFRF